MIIAHTVKPRPEAHMDMVIIYEQIEHIILWNKYIRNGILNQTIIFSFGF